MEQIKGIKGFVGVSLIEFPGYISSVVFLGGCNLRCPFCQNRDLVLKPNELEDIDFAELVEALGMRKRLIDGVAITGGEPLIFGELERMIERFRELGLAVKIDTNGMHPDRLKSLIDSKLVDYVAMDFKTSLDRYDEACGKKVDISRFERSVDLLLEGKVDYEFRTTCVPGLVTEREVELIAERIAGARLYALHQFRNEYLLDPEWEKLTPYRPEKLREFAKIAAGHVEKVITRGIG